MCVCVSVEPLLYLKMRVRPWKYPLVLVLYAFCAVASVYIINMTVNAWFRRTFMYLNFSTPVCVCVSVRVQ